MQYKYRWFYALAAVFLIVFGGYYFDFQPLFEKHAKLIKQEKRLLNRLKSFKPISNQPSLIVSSATLNDTELLAELNIFAHLNNVTLVAAKHIKMKTVELVLQGSFDQLALFAETINHSGTMMLLEFACHKMPVEKMEMTMQVIVLPYSISKLSSKKNNIAVYANEEMFLLTQMKMTGMLRQGKRLVALVALPSQRVIAVNVGSRIGKEQGVVRAIYHDRIIVELNKKRVTIKDVM